MTICTNCNGDGIVGQGPEPWLKQGHKETCKKCSGTGKIDDTQSTESVQTPPDGPASTDGEPAPVDNQPLPKEGDSQDGSGDQASQSDA